ncbi:MAG: TonB-dependent receptor [Pseudoxanthomonas sp.]
MTTQKTPNHFSRCLRRSALSLALGLCVAGGAQAQTNTAGAIAGRASAGDSITISNPATGFSRTITVGNDGTYRVAQLPNGNYQISQNNGVPRNVAVSVGTTSSVDFSAAAATNFDTVVVTGVSGNPIDIQSVESTVVLTESAIDRLPVNRDVSSLALLVPGTTLGSPNLPGNTGETKPGLRLAAFGGSSVAENVYYVNGFNVTNLINGLAFSELPFEAISETQIKSGGYGAEFGRSLGGVVNVIGKRGSNAWHFGGNAIYSPDDVARGSALRWIKDPTTDKWISVENDSYNQSLTYNLYASGPIVKDKLFFYALAQAADTTQKTFGNTSQNETTTDAPQYYFKLDWQITDNHLLEVTAFRDRLKQEVQNWKSLVPYARGKGEAFLGPDKFEWGGDNYIGKWTGYFGDNLALSALYGVGKYNHTSVVPSSDCPIVQDLRTAPTVSRGCWTNGVIDDPNANEKRTAYRFDGEWTLGKHTLRFGIDNEEYDFLGGSVFSGGTTMQVRRLANGGRLSNNYVNTSGADMFYVQMRHFENGGEFTLKNSAYYLEDSWQVTDNFLAYLGIRNESFENLNAAGDTFVKIDNTWAPRLGFAWDMNGDASFKVFGNLGRYYIPVMGNTNIRLSGAELDYTDFYVWDGTWATAATEAPGRGAKLGDTLLVSDGQTPDPRTVVDPNLKPMYQDELILGFQALLADKWTGGVRFVHRDLKSVMDDVCNDEGAYNWAVANGYSAADAGAIADTVGHCFLYNPGNSLTANVDFGDGDLTAVTIPAEAMGMPQPKRKYQALEFFFERVWDGKWSLQGSYTLSRSIGNAEGYVKSDINQADAGISQDWDYPGLMEGAYGHLPNDRRHVFKLFGAYQINEEWRAGGNFVVQSGRPRNCIGFYDGDLDGVSIYYGPASFWCDGELHPRGTLGRLEWSSTLSLNLTYEPRWAKGLRLSADVFNVLNDRSVLSITETCETSVGTASPTCWQPTALNPARQARFTVEYDF